MLNKTYRDAITGSLWTIAELYDKDPWSGANMRYMRLTSPDTPDRYLSPKGLEDLLRLKVLEEV